MNTDFVLSLAQRLSLPDEALKITQDIIEYDADVIDRIVADSSLDNITAFEREIKKSREHGAAVCLVAALSVCEKTYNEYQMLGIPDKVFYDTMGDITTWVKTAIREEKIVGLLEISWLRHSLYMNLFKLGRLQFQFYKTDYLRSGLSIKNSFHAPIPNKSQVLNIHIPEGDRLDFYDCQQSIATAREFFKTFFPQYIFKGFVCDSWLIDTNNSSFMSDTSNIVRFSELFDCIYPSRFHNNEMVRRLWNVKTFSKADIKGFPETTDLQQRAKKYLLSGGKTSNGYGFIL